MATKALNEQLKAGLQAAWKGRPESARSVSPAIGRQPPPEPRSVTPPPLEADEAAAFRAAVAGTQPLPPANRVVLAKPPVRRLKAQPAFDESETSLRPMTGASDDGLPAHWHREGSIPRLPDDPEARALAIAMAGVAPLPDCNRVVLGGPQPTPSPQQRLADERAALHESLHGQIALQDRLEGGDEAFHLRPGLSQTVLRDLRRGRWVIQSELDLHGLTRDEARHQLATFLTACLHHGKRCVRVIHGKGHGSPQKLSILRQLVRGWLAQRDEVLAYCQAKPQDGGEGALVALLRAPKK